MILTIQVQGQDIYPVVLEHGGGLEPRSRAQRRCDYSTKAEDKTCNPPITGTEA